MVSSIEKWRLRHAYPDALGVWASATGAEARAMAFNAIAQDPRVLQRAARRQAIRMAAQAEDFALSLTDGALAASEAWRAAVLYVQRAIDAWRHSLKAYDQRADGPAISFEPTISPTESADPWEIARRNFPLVDDATGRLATRLLHEFGGSLLRRTRKPWDHVIALAVLRYAARRLRDELPEQEPGHTRACAVADVLALQSYAEETGLSPMQVGYTNRSKPAVQALGLARDARTLHDAVRGAQAGGNERSVAWRHAMDFHAFALVALDHRILLELPLEEAYALAAAAVRHAEAVMRQPDGVNMPALPAGSASAPDVVRLHARACLPPDAASQPIDHHASTGREAPSIERIADSRAPSTSATDSDAPRTPRA
jgi:hypothetical protein